MRTGRGMTKRELTVSKFSPQGHCTLVYHGYRFAYAKAYRSAYPIGWSAIALPLAYRSFFNTFTKQVQLTYLYTLFGQLVLVTPDGDLKTGGES